MKYLYFKKKELLEFLVKYKSDNNLSYTQLNTHIDGANSRAIVINCSEHTALGNVFKTKNKGLLNLKGAKKLLASQQEIDHYINTKNSMRAVAAHKRHGTAPIKFRPKALQTSWFEPKNSAVYYTTFSTFHVYDGELKPILTPSKVEKVNQKRRAFFANHPELFEVEFKTFAQAKSELDKLERLYMGENKPSMEFDDHWGI